MSERTCQRCAATKPLAEFEGERGLVNACATCREKYNGWANKTLVEKMIIARGARKKLDVSRKLRVRFVRESANRKTGPIPVTATSASTCPPTCTWFGAGCYAEMVHWTRLHWSRVVRQGATWKEFCAHVRELPDDQVWRHNEAGDLPGFGDKLDAQLLRMLVRANAGKRGFTYTHKPLRDPDERRAVREANEAGFTINLSADTLDDVDRLADLQIAPVTVVVSRDYPRKGKTPGGRHVIVCPFETHEIQCADCKLCAVPSRKSVVAFHAHGPAAAMVEERIVQLRLPLARQP